MRTHAQKYADTDKNVYNQPDPKEIVTDFDLPKVEWLRIYSRRLLKSWFPWQTTLGVAPACVRQIEIDLAGFYDDPLKRMFIEATYF